MVVAVVAFAIATAICLVNVAFPELMGKWSVRMIAASPGPIRRFYTVASLGRPQDGPFWNNYRRVGGLAAGLLMLTLLTVFSIFGFGWFGRF